MVAMLSPSSGGLFVVVTLKRATAMRTRWSRGSGTESHLAFTSSKVTSTFFCFCAWLSSGNAESAARAKSLSGSRVFMGCFG